MACGNNKITRAYLSSPPSSVAVPQPEQLAFYAGHLAKYYADQIAGRKLSTGEYFLPDGRDQNLVPSMVRERYENSETGLSIHLHAKPADEDPSKWVFVAKDTGDDTGWYDQKGHFMKAELPNNPSHKQIEDQKALMFSTLNARLSKRGF